MRVNRVAYREFSREPGLPFGEFKRRLGKEIFGDASSAQAIEDLLEIQRCFFHGRTWWQASPITSPARVRAMKERAELKPGKVADFRAALDRIREIASRHRSASNPGARELHRIASWVGGQWTGRNAELLAGATSEP